MMDWLGSQPRIFWLLLEMTNDGTNRIGFRFEISRRKCLGKPHVASPNMSSFQVPAPSFQANSIKWQHHHKSMQWIDWMKCLHRFVIVFTILHFLNSVHTIIMFKQCSSINFERITSHTAIAKIHCDYSFISNSAKQSHQTKSKEISNRIGLGMPGQVGASRSGEWLHSNRHVKKWRRFSEASDRISENVHRSLWHWRAMWKGQPVGDNTIDGRRSIIDVPRNWANLLEKANNTRSSSMVLVGSVLLFSLNQNGNDIMRDNKSPIAATRI